MRNWRKLYLQFSLFQIILMDLFIATDPSKIEKIQNTLEKEPKVLLDWKNKTYILILWRNVLPIKWLYVHKAIVSFVFKYLICPHPA